MSGVCVLLCWFRSGDSSRVRGLGHWGLLPPFTPVHPEPVSGTDSEQEAGQQLWALEPSTVPPPPRPLPRMSPSQGWWIETWFCPTSSSLLGREGRR